MSSHPATSSTQTRRRKSRVRPVDQSAQVILRMSPERRAELHAAAAATGHSSLVQYLLELHDRDTAARSASTALALSSGSVPNAESPGPTSWDQGSHAEARRTVTAAAG